MMMMMYFSSGAVLEQFFSSLLVIVLFAVFSVQVKYDTRLTTKTNGSIKAVRRDKTVMLLQDSGAVTYTPRAAWGAKVRAVVLI